MSSAQYDPERVALIVNPASASGKTAQRWRAVMGDLQSHGVRLVAHVTEGARHATAIARGFVEAGGREIIVLGGDGTLQEVVDGCVRDGRPLRRDITLSVIHQGTGGDFARGLGIPRDTDAAAAVAARGSTRPVDVIGAVFSDSAGEERHAALIGGASIGTGPEVVRRATGSLKRLGGSGAFAIATVISLLRNQSRTIRLRVDSQHEWQQLQVADVMIANNRYMGGGMIVAPRAEVDDGELDVMIFATTSRLRLIAKVPKLFRGTVLDDPLVRCQRARQVWVESPTPQEVVFDGELAGATPVRFEVIPQALSVRVPA